MSYCEELDNLMKEYKDNFEKMRNLLCEAIKRLIKDIVLFFT
ncbi:hypothetical protein [Caldicellulosiruptor morganii]|uniref:Uncharacterized protein n=1 Tax=Caldicellulosiruptor morganii TaxID=1387555 RepID=A0ABY7BMT2_9FIRM|nr:hypothetical protein [Caldicellulosiruptor morganii]WAM33045.1 hypothetical protein OTK00_001506 [Caldicellulosiruptor morganii]